MVPEVVNILEEMRALHEKKSAGYGSDQDPLHNFNAVAKASGVKNYYYPILRCIEKLTRASNLYYAGRDDELEEEFKDVALLMVLAEAMRREEKNAPELDKHSLTLLRGVATPKEIDKVVNVIVNNNEAANSHPIEPRSSYEDAIKEVLPDDVRNVLTEPNCPDRPEIVWKDGCKVEIIQTDIAPDSSPHDIMLTDALINLSLAATKREAHILATTGDIYVNNRKVWGDIPVKNSDVIRKGKRQSATVRTSYPLGKENE